MVTYLKLSIYSLIANLLIISLGFAAVSIGSTKSELSSTNMTSMVKCPSVVVNGTTLNSSSQTPSFGDPTCQDTSTTSGGIGVYVAGFNFSIDCPKDYPYIGSIREEWGMAMTFFVLNGGATMRGTCCSGPRPPMSLTYGPNQWHTGTSCP